MDIVQEKNRAAIFNLDFTLMTAIHKFYLGRLTDRYIDSWCTGREMYLIVKKHYQKLD